MRKFQKLDEVLVRAWVIAPPDSTGKVALHIAFSDSYGTRCSESSIIGLASEFERRSWVPVTERLPEKEGEYEVTRRGQLPGRLVSVSHFYRDICLFMDRGFISSVGDCVDDVVAWKPASAPYTPPAPAFDCGKCQHKPVCRFVAADKHLDRDYHCGGEHYAAKEES